MRVVVTGTWSQCGGGHLSWAGAGSGSWKVSLILVLRTWPLMVMVVMMIKILQRSWTLIQEMMIDFLLRDARTA